MQITTSHCDFLIGQCEAHPPGFEWTRDKLIRSSYCGIHSTMHVPHHFHWCPMAYRGMERRTWDTSSSRWKRKEKAWGRGRQRGRTTSDHKIREITFTKTRNWAKLERQQWWLLNLYIPGEKNGSWVCVEKGKRVLLFICGYFSWTWRIPWGQVWIESHNEFKCKENCWPFKWHLPQHDPLFFYFTFRSLTFQRLFFCFVGSAWNCKWIIHPKMISLVFYVRVELQEEEDQALFFIASGLTKLESNWLPLVLG